jgi:hypothetical protein
MRAKRAIRFARKKRGRFAQRAQVLRSAESTLLRMTSLGGWEAQVLRSAESTLLRMTSLGGWEAQVLRSAESTLLRMTSLEKPHKSLAVPRMAKPGLAQAGSGSQKGRMQ